MSNIPKDLKYTFEHEWVHIEGDEATIGTIGITDFLQDYLGDFVFIELLRVGSTFSAVQRLHQRTQLHHLGTQHNTPQPGYICGILIAHHYRHALLYLLDLKMYDTCRWTREVDNIWVDANLKWYGGRKKGRYSAPNYSTVIQRAAASALTGPQACVAGMRQVYQHRRDLAVSLLQDLGRYAYTPHGAFYILVDVSSPDGTGRLGRQFALDLLRECNIAVAPGSTFGSVVENYARISLAASDEEIVRGVRGICAFADSY
jgi:hypothetical protein